MIVDDEQPCLDELEYLLTRYSDIEITGTYTNPLEALLAAESSSPDAVFLDVVMPYLNGLELAEKIQMLGDVQVVFVSAHSMFFNEAIKKRQYECLLKPVSESKLSSVVGRLHEKQRMFPSNQK